MSSNHICLTVSPELRGLALYGPFFAEAWMGGSAFLMVGLHHLLRGCGRSRELNLYLHPLEFIFGLLDRVMAGAGSPIRLRLLPSRNPRDFHRFRPLP
ncbi:hypothetical protein F2Q69_00010698 [Brassica cretica]|uniref:Uncharacterized protein n=1 Tax=Brassica cretica TaxID=69181 RepID=A0A8S9QY96_BRACR|nr:hypothetical protein F2Q69_00010698 [Brassica cretica]